MFIAGRVAGLFTVVAAMVFTLVGLSLARKRPFHMRAIPGLKAVEEAVGRATEMGKPIFYSPGYADVAGTTAPPTLAGLNLLAHVGRLAARYNTRLVVTVGHANTYALATEILRNAYVVEGKVDSFDIGTYTSHPMSSSHSPQQASASSSARNRPRRSSPGTSQPKP